MPAKKYTAEFKSKTIIAILQGDKEFNEVCSESNLNPNMVRQWKKDFIENAYKIFDETTERKNARRKEADLKKTNDQMLKTIGQLTLERDFLQGCFRQAGVAAPAMPVYD